MLNGVVETVGRGIHKLSSRSGENLQNNRTKVEDCRTEVTGKCRCEKVRPDSRNNGDRREAIFGEKLFKIFPNLKNPDLRNCRFSQIVS